MARHKLSRDISFLVSKVITPAWHQRPAIFLKAVANIASIH